MPQKKFQIIPVNIMEFPVLKFLGIQNQILSKKIFVIPMSGLVLKLRVTRIRFITTYAISTIGLALAHHKHQI